MSSLFSKKPESFWLTMAEYCYKIKFILIE